MTIVQAAQEALKISKKPLTYKEIYAEIIRLELYQFGASYPEGVVNNKIRKHCYGLDFPSSSPVKYFIISGNSKKLTKYALLDKSITKKAVIKKEPSSKEDKLPEENIQTAYLEHKKTIGDLLLHKILTSDPAFFERLVIDLLIAMGYGGNFPNAGSVKGGSGDGGIDGVIKEDKLGLGKIYVQAKRYTDKTIGRPAIQQFVGAMENVNKGVFLTTSSFAQTAQNYVQSHQKSIVLVDGAMLSELMIDHGIGISTVEQYSTYRIDTDYFDDE